MNKITTFSEILLQTLKIYENMAIITCTKIGHRVKFYITCISGPWYLIMVESPSSHHGRMCEDADVDGCQHTFGWWETTVNLDVSTSPQGQRGHNLGNTMYISSYCQLKFTWYKWLILKWEVHIFKLKCEEQYLWFTCPMKSFTV